MVSEASYPIREVSRMTGVNPTTLRAWQRRYGLVIPARTASGHRLYSDQDIETIEQILKWLEKGVSIGQVKLLLKSQSAKTDGSNWDQLVTELLELSQQLNIKHLENRLSELSKLYPIELFTSKLIRPWLDNLSKLKRPDQSIIYQSSNALLQQLLTHWISIKTGPVIGLLRCGQSSVLDSLLLRYQLQGMECRSLDLGKIEPSQLALAEERLELNAYVV